MPINNIQISTKQYLPKFPSRNNIYMLLKSNLYNFTDFPNNKESNPHVLQILILSFRSASDSITN